MALAWATGNVVLDVTFLDMIPHHLEQNRLECVHVSFAHDLCTYTI